MTNKTLFAAALLAVASSVATAQTDFGSPIGAGGGLGGAVAPLGVPSVGNMPGSPASASAGLGSARSAFVAATGAGPTVANPAGGTVAVPPAIAQAVGAVLGGGATPAQVNAANAAFGGTPAAAALTQALQTLGGSGGMNYSNVSNAVAAYNAAVDALPPGQAPGPGLLAARSVLAGIVTR